MKTKAQNELIEEFSRRGAYDMLQTLAIVDHHTHGRVLISQGFGGMDSLEGGTYRWKHGYVVKVSSTDTIEHLLAYGDAGFQNVDLLDRIDWPGHVISKVAESVGL